MVLSAEDLLAGVGCTHRVEVPRDLVAADGAGAAGQGASAANGSVIVRPLTVRDLQRISKAALDDNELSAALMIQQAVVEPELNLDQVSALPAGLARFLIERINAVSGISTPQGELRQMVQAPLARACFLLSREFGWTPDEVSAMTLGQILMYLEMSQGDERP